MTPAEQAQVDSIEKARRRREAALLALLLLFIGGSALVNGTWKRNRRSLAWRLSGAIDHGIDPATTIRDTILGNAVLHLPGIVPSLAAAMADTSLAGTLSVFKQAGLVPTDLPTVEQLATAYQSDAVDVARGVAESITGIVQRTMHDATVAGLRNRMTARAVLRSLQRYGWTAGDPAGINEASKGSPGYSAVGVSTDTILEAWKRGSGMGWLHPRVASVLTGFAHMGVVDKRQSQICRERSVPPLILPKHDDYWRHGVPPLHARCRSLLLGAFGPQKWSTVYPTTPPEPGWGAWPLPVFPSGMTL